MVLYQEYVAKILKENGIDIQNEFNRFKKQV